MTRERPDSPHVDEPTSHSTRASRKEARAAAIAAGSQAESGARRRRLPLRFPAVVFFVLGAISLWAAFIEAASNTVWAPNTVYTFVMQAIGPVVAVLIPGALLWRHPDAWRRARTLLFGTFVFASVTFFRAIEGGMQAFFKQATPPPADLTWFIPSAMIYTSLVALIGLFGLLYIGLGLTRARNYAFTGQARNAGIVILVVALLSVLGRLWTLTGVNFNDPTLTLGVWIYIGSIIVIGILTILVWTYVTRVLTRCAISGEEPVPGWTIAAIGACLFLSSYLILAWSSFVTITDQTLVDVVTYLRQFATGVGGLLLLAGFALGLPSLERVVWDDEEPTS